MGNRQIERARPGVPRVLEMAVTLLAQRTLVGEGGLVAMVQDARRLAQAIASRLREYDGLVARAETQADRSLAVPGIETVKRSALEASAQAADSQVRRGAAPAESAAARRGA